GPGTSSPRRSPWTARSSGGPRRWPCEAGSAPPGSAPPGSAPPGSAPPGLLVRAVAVEEPFQFAAFALGGASRAALAAADRDERRARRRGRALVDEALGGRGRPDPLADDLLHDDDPLPPVVAQPDHVAGPHRGGRLGALVVHPDVARAAGGRRHRAGL